MEQSKNLALFLQRMNPKELDYLVELETFPDFMRHIKEKFGSHPAIIEDGIAHTYDDLFDDTLKICGALKELGIKRGEHLGVILPNSYDLSRLLLGIMAYGAVPLVMPFQLGEEAIFGSITKYDLKMLVFHPAVEERLSLSKTKLPTFTFLGINTFDTHLKMGEFNSTAQGSDLGCIEFSGGTSGVPKGAMLSHKNLLMGAMNGCLGITDFLYQTYYTILPLSHVFGLIRSFLSALYSGSRITFAKNMNNIFREMPQVQPTIMILVPALAETILNVIKKFGFSIVGGKLRIIISGAATVPPYLIDEYKKFGVDFFPGYGLTESANLVSGNIFTDKSATSVGIIYPTMDVKIVDGELLIKGPNVFMGYYNAPEENAQAFVDGYFKTGDLVILDENNMLHIVGRNKDIIVLPNGENISPNQVETKFLELSIVQDCLLYEDENNKLILEVLPRNLDGEQTNREEQNKAILTQLDQVNRTLPPFMQINQFIIRIEDFKRTPAMKIIRPKRGI